MFMAWTKHITDPEEKIRFENSVQSSKHVLDRLKDMLDEQERDLNRAETDPRNYETPNWDYRQAHNNGYRQCLAVLKKFVDLDQQNKSLKTIVEERMSNGGKPIRGT